MLPLTSDPDRTLSEPDSAELQEAVSKTTFSHEVANLEAATTYSIYLKAYSALGGSQQSSTITATTKGGGRFHCLSAQYLVHNEFGYICVISTVCVLQFPVLPASSPRS